MKKTKQKKTRLGQYDAKYFLTGLNISEPLRFATLHRSVFNDLQKVFLTLYGPRSLDDLLAYGVKGCKDVYSSSLHLARPRSFYPDSASSSLQSGLMSPVKLLTIVEGGTNVRSNRVYELSAAKGSSDKAWTLGRYQVSRPSGMEDSLMSPVKQLAIIKDNLLAYRVKGCKAMVSSFLCLFQPRSFYLDSASTPLQSLNLSPTKFLIIVVGCRTFVSKVLLRRALRGLSDEFLRTFCGKKYEPRHGSSGIKAKHSVMEDKRNLIITIASTELGVKETTGNNDGPRVEQYLRYTNLGPGYDWCASFVSWVYGQAGFSAPRNPWSPALFPRARTYKDTDEIQQADLFGIYSNGLKRIHHVGLIRSKQGQYILTIEGNSNNRVESRRRHVKTVYCYADWIK